MDKATDANASSVKLDSLSIRGFRGIEELDIPKLERFTLIAGRNGVGKSTVLDAVSVYAAQGQYDSLRELLARRDESFTFQDEDGNFVDVPAFDRLFHWNTTKASTIEIGPLDGGPTLKIEEENNAEERKIGVAFGNWKRSYAWRGTGFQFSPFDTDREAGHETPPTPCVLLCPGLLANNDVASLWDRVALTDDETLARDALRLAFGDQVERAAVVGEARRNGRRVMVKLTDHRQPVPLKSLGDGATRMFVIALALANCRDGILLIDEAEDGIHYSIQDKFWSMILSAAQMHNVQVLATTHSKDCIDGFAAAALECPQIEGNLVHIRWHKGKMRAVKYSKEELGVAAEQDIEVR